MKKYIFICDKCKKEIIQDSLTMPKEWRTIQIRTSSGSQYDYHETCLCNECQIKLGLFQNEKQDENVNEESTRDKLYNIIADIIYENSK